MIVELTDMTHLHSALTLHSIEEGGFEHGNPDLESSLSHYLLILVFAGFNGKYLKLKVKGWFGFYKFHSYKGSFSGIIVFIRNFTGHTLD